MSNYLRNGAHQRVAEHNGAFQCLNCGVQWGAAINLPKEIPAQCVFQGIIEYQPPAADPAGELDADERERLAGVMRAVSAWLTGSGHGTHVNLNRGQTAEDCLTIAAHLTRHP